MESSKIMDADILDILFEGRNKEYGAYDLRKTYNRRLTKAIGSMLVVLLLLLVGYFVSGRNSRNTAKPPNVDDITLDQVKAEKKIEPLPLPKIELPKTATIKFTTIKIVKDKEVTPDEKPPEVDKLDDTKIAAVNQEGVKDEGLTAPPSSDGGKGVVEAPKKDDEDYDKTFVSVQIESSYPGGMPAWQRYLNKNLRFPEEAVNNEIQGTVVVQFIVDKEGNVSDVQAIGGPDNGGLRDEAVRVIKKSGKWTPAIQNGRQVRSYKKQPITFRIDGQ
jgi:protein TonB